jgi:hypothetical protein
MYRAYNIPCAVHNVQHTLQVIISPAVNVIECGEDRKVMPVINEMTFLMNECTTAVDATVRL